jgi:type VII secretion integral membrane protein EccD
VSHTVVTPGAPVRISVVGENRRLDVAVPGTVPLIEFVPGFARALGVLDPTVVHGGYALARADGSELDLALGATGQGVADGDLLTLVRGGLVNAPRVYDDLTEAVIDAAAEHGKPWTPRDSARTALAVSLTLLGVCAILLTASGDAKGLSALLAGVIALVLLVMTAVLPRVGQVDAGNAFGIAGAAYAAIAAFLVVPGADRWGWPLAAAAGAAVVFAAIAVALATQRREVHLAPLCWGFVLLIPATVTGLDSGYKVTAFAITAAVMGAIGNLLPWLALSSTRLRVISAQSEQEVFAAPEPIDAETVKARAQAGARMLNAMRIGIGIALVCATPVVASANVAGALLMAFAFAGMLFQSRQIYARAGVLAVMTTGAIGIVAVGLTIIATQPGMRSALLIALVAAVTVLVSLTLLPQRARLRLGRAGDTVEVLLLTLLLPLGVIAAGWA